MPDPLVPAMTGGMTAWTTIAILSAGLSTMAFVVAQDVGIGSVLKPAVDDRITCTVVRVHDGDGPIWCAEGPRIRLTAIAARELDESCNPHHPCPAASGASAKAALTKLAMGKVLQCEPTGRSYGRTTAWCWRPDGVELNCAMVQGGWAARWDRYDPDRRMCR